MRQVYDLARLERLRDWLADPETMADATFRAMIAEAAGRGFDPGRRAWIRWRWIYGWATRFLRLPRAVLRVGAEGFLAAERCRCALV
jgi:hypothetical protein